MYPDLSYIFHDLFGTAPDNIFSVVKTFGLMLVLAITGAAWLLKKEFFRKEAEGLLESHDKQVWIGKPTSISEYLINSFWGFLLGFKGYYLYLHSQELGDTVKFLLSTQGHLVAGLIGAALFGFFTYLGGRKGVLDQPYQKTVKVWPHDVVYELAVVAGLSGVVGAKLFASFESIEGIKAFFRNPIKELIGGSGLAIYGGLIVAFVVCYFWLKKRGIKVIHVMDAVAPSLMVGYGIGRMGCQLSGDGDWGINNLNPTPSWWFLPDSWWASTYPRNVLNMGEPIKDCVGNYCHELSQAVYPTPIYEIFMAFLIAGILWALRKRIKAPGALFFLYMIFNGIERFFIEKIRINDKIDLGGIEMTQAEIIAIAFVLVGIIGFIIRYRIYRKSSVA